MPETQSPALWGHKWSTWPKFAHLSSHHSRVKQDQNNWKQVYSLVCCVEILNSCINNKYLNQMVDSWLRIPGVVSDLIYNPLPLSMPHPCSLIQTHKIFLLSIWWFGVKRMYVCPMSHQLGVWLLNHLFSGLNVTISPRTHYLLISQVLYRYLIPHIVYYTHCFTVFYHIRPQQIRNINKSSDNIHHCDVWWQR